MSSTCLALAPAHAAVQARIAGLSLAALLWLPPAVAEMTDASAHVHAAVHGVRVSMANYVLPETWLVRDDGKKVLLAKEIDDGKPVLLNFVYTTCPGICPVMSQVFSQFQTRLGAESSKLHMVSISIDPEQDTPARLRDYAQRFSAGAQWRHYTGSVAASVAVQKAFNAYRGDKMSHDPLTLMRLAPGQPWVRLDGFATDQDLLTEYLGLAARCETASATR